MTPQGTPSCGVRIVNRTTLSRALLGQLVLAATCCLAARAETPAGETLADQKVFLDRRQLPLEYAGPGREIADPDPLPEVRIGYFGPDDPSHPEAGDLWSAASLAVEQANRQGGYRGQPFRLVPGWSDNPWSGGAAEVTRMVYRDEVWAIVGGIDGPSTHVAEQITTKARLPLVCAASSDRTANAAIVPWIFTLLPGDHVQAPVLAAELASRTPGPRWVVIAGEDHDSRCFLAELQRSFRKHAVAPQFQFVYRPSAAAAADVAQRSLQARPDAIVLVADPQGSAQIVLQLRAAGFAGDIFAGPSLGRRRFIEQTATASAGLVFPLLLDPGKNWPEFATAFHSHYGHHPDYAAASTYDAVQLLVAAVRQAGLNRARIADALRRLSPWEGVAGVVRWDTLGGNIRPVQLGTIRDGGVCRLELHGEHPAAESQTHWASRPRLILPGRSGLI